MAPPITQVVRILVREDAYLQTKRVNQGSHQKCQNLKVVLSNKEKAKDMWGQYKEKHKWNAKDIKVLAREIGKIR